ncbi:MAG: hypothetical protein AAB647_02655, partial [Patescibacteria group bacterium]
MTQPKSEGFEPFDPSTITLSEQPIDPGQLSSYSSVFLQQSTSANDDMLKTDTSDTSTFRDAIRQTRDLKKEMRK